jgi:predicted metalloprotease with PDZ domain
VTGRGRLPPLYFMFATIAEKPDQAFVAQQTRLPCRHSRRLRVDCAFMRRFPLCLLLLLAVALPIPWAPSRAAVPAVPQAIEYRLGMRDPASHLLEVSITVPFNDAPLEFQMPAWSPGRYVIYDFARNVQDVAALDARSRPLAVQKVDKQTWRVAASAAEKPITFAYRIFADDLSGTFSQFNQHHANVNGASVFMYVVGHKPDPIRLTIDTPIGWRAVSGLGGTSETINAPNYDVLIDNPIEVGPSFDLRTFQLDGRTYNVMTHQMGDHEEPDRFVADVERIVRTETAIMGGPPDLERYAFLIHFAPDAFAGDGMEHLYSTQIVRTHELGEGRSYDGLLEVTAHEFFHVWNVKRLRPAELGPWDYTKENYTRSLWVAEGITSYYSNVVLARAGLWNEERFLRSFAAQILTLQETPGRRVMNLEQSSLDTWYYVAPHAKQRTNTRNVSVNYYNKGQVVGALLDLEIRHRTNSAKSLDDVFRLLYKRFYTDAQPETYYLKGRGFKPADFLAAVNEVSGSSFAEFFAKYVTGTDELEYNTQFGYAGLALEKERSGYRIEERRSASVAQKAFRADWLGTKAAARSAG